MQITLREKQIAHSAIKNWGAIHQVNKTLEELFELIVAISQHKKHFGRDRDIVIDEIADVWVTTIQMAILMDWEKCVERFDFKMKRLQGLIPQETDCRIVQ